MPKIRMIKNSFASDVNGQGVTLHPKYYLAGQEYEVGQGLAHALVQDLGHAEYVQKQEAKTLPPAPENKMEKIRPAKKRGKALEGSGA